MRIVVVVKLTIIGTNTYGFHAKSRHQVNVCLSSIFVNPYKKIM